MTELEHELSAADVVVTCTGADGQVVPADVIERAMASRPDRPLFVLDIALPRDVDPRAATLDGVTLLDLDSLTAVTENAAGTDDVREARRIVDVELAAYLAARRASGVAPTVVALRDKAAQMVSAELHRLEHRLPNLDEAARNEIAATVRRVVDKVLHAPTVRVQELADTAGPPSYPEALRTLVRPRPGRAAAIASPRSRRRPMSTSSASMAPARVIRLGTRKSALATAQAGTIAELLRAHGSPVELVGVTTDGDRSRAATIDRIAESDGVGVFVAELRTQLLDGTRRHRRPLAQGPAHRAHRARCASARCHHAPTRVTPWSPAIS